MGNPLNKIPRCSGQSTNHTVESTNQQSIHFHPGEALEVDKHSHF
jgi:hypothetical protein